MRVRMVILAVLGLFALVACNGDAGDIEAPPTEELANEINADIADLGQEMEEAEMPETLQNEWNDLETQIEGAVDAVLAEEDVDTAALQAELDAFQEQIDSAGDTVTQDMTETWESLRDRVEALLA